MSINVGTNSWVTEVEANTYFGDRIRASDYWTDGAADNAPALVTAYKWLNAGKYAFPTSATQPIKDAQCEYAFFLLQHQPDLDLRMGLQVQGVTAAGVVKEKYKGGNFIALPIPPIVEQLLDNYDTERAVYLINIERNENEGVGYNAYDNLLNDVT